MSTPWPVGFGLESHRGLQARLAKHPVAEGHSPDSYRQRLDIERDVICKMGFASYFLIVRDFIAFVRSKGIGVWPGRGSVAGSLVAYALRITDLDPLKHGLIFERFLNPERVSMPDLSNAGTVYRANSGQILPGS